MTRQILNIVVVMALTVLPLEASSDWGEALPSTEWTPAAPLQTDQTYAVGDGGPVMFIENVGQWDSGARFQLRGGPTGTFWLAEDAIWITALEPPETRGQTGKRPDTALRWLSENRRYPTSRRGVNIKLRFAGANPRPHIETFDRLETAVSYFHGDDPDQWQPNVPVWGGVRYVDLYPGVNLEVTGVDGRWQWTFHLKAGAQLPTVALTIEGVDEATLTENIVSLATAVGVYNLPLLQVRGSSHPLPTPVVLHNQVRSPFAESFSLAATAPDAASSLVYATYLGGSDLDEGDSIFVDATGAAYVTGYTASVDFPTTPGVFDATYNLYDAYVAKLHAAGTGLIFATFLGGSGAEHGDDIAVGGAGAIYITGSTSSSDFPITGGAFDASYHGAGDVFVVKMNQTGTGLIYATYLGGSEVGDGYGIDEGFGIAVDGAGGAFVTGRTSSVDFPVTLGALDPTYNYGVGDVFITKLNLTGSGLVYSTFYGDTAFEQGNDIAIDGAGAAYVMGTIGSEDYFYWHAFVAKVNPAGSGFTYFRLLDGLDWDFGNGIAVDGTGAAYVTGDTYCADFPTTPGAFDITYNGSRDVFVTKLNSDGSELVYSTFLGSSGVEYGYDIAVDATGSAFVTGSTSSTDFPTTPDAFDATHNGERDVFVARLNPTGSELVYSTFLGGNSLDFGSAIAVGRAGDVYVTGRTQSSNFPTTSGAFDGALGGYSDAFVVRMNTRSSSRFLPFVTH